MIVTLVAFLVVAIVGLAAAARRGALPVSIAYNVGNKRDRIVLADLNRMIRRERPDVIGLNEIHDRIKILHQVAERRGYRLGVGPNRDGKDHVALLVAPESAGVVLRKTGLRRLSGPRFVGFATAGSKKDGVAGAKYIYWARLVIRGRRRKPGVTHLVPSAGRKGNWRTKTLHGVQVAGCAAWLRGSLWPAYLMGDMNAEAGSALMRALRVVARLYAPAGKYMDRIILFAVNRRIRGRVESLPSYSSDHNPSKFTETPKPRKTRRKENR